MFEVEMLMFIHNRPFKHGQLAVLTLTYLPNVKTQKGTLSTTVLRELGHCSVLVCINIQKYKPYFNLTAINYFQNKSLEVCDSSNLLLCIHL